MQGDFGVSATIEVATETLASLSLVGTLPQPQAEFWRGLKRLDFGLQFGKVEVVLWTGDSPTPVGHAFAAGQIDQPVQLGVRKVGDQLIFLAAGQEVGQLPDPGLFASGEVFLGVNVAPGNQLTIHSLSVETPDGAATNVNVMPVLARVDTPADSLRSIAQQRGFRIGSFTDLLPFLEDPRYRQTLAHEFNEVTPVIWWNSIRPTPDRWDFCYPDAFVAFAEANDMEIRSPSLAYDAALPGWLAEGNYSRDELIAALSDYIHTIVERYRGRVATWEPVNEAISYKPGDYTLRDQFLLQKIGPEYIDMAFRWAHEADPQARLIYNDFGGEGLGGKSDAIYALVKGLQQRGVPIDGVGLQMHVRLPEASLYGVAVPPITDVAANMQRYADLGLLVYITEMDVLVGRNATQAQLEAQARAYADMLRVCLAASNCPVFSVWGVTDRYSWIRTILGFTWEQPLPFDQEFQPKPAYNALRDVLAGR